MLYKQKQAITSSELWRNLAPPKQARHWRAGRSAQTLAEIWTTTLPDMPPEIMDCLAQHPDFSQPISWRGEPEARWPFDAFAGEGCNMDLGVVACDAFGPLLIGIEAKTDEPFGKTLAEQARQARLAREKNPRSRQLERLAQLQQMVLSGPAPEQTRFRYQLLTATAGLLHTAVTLGISRAILLIEVFVTSASSVEKQAHNSADLNAFVKQLSQGRQKEISYGQLSGPFKLPGQAAFRPDVRLYLGKVCHDLRSNKPASAQTAESEHA